MSVTSVWYWQGEKVLSIWIKTKDVEKYSPITQVYGIVFNEKDQILICRKKGGSWQIPGGHPEKQETIEETLTRELIEEVDVIVTDIKILGVQSGVFPDKPETKTHYQVRCIAKLKELLPQTFDPDNGELWERKFVAASKVTNYVKWNETGDAMFTDAIELRKASGK